MKKGILAFTSILVLSQVNGQKTAYKISFNSGLFCFTGESSVKTSAILYSEISNSSYTNNPYGAKNGLCYGIAGNLRRVSKKNFLVGFELGYEKLRSKVQINQVSGYTGTSIYQYGATGKTFLNFDFINMNPFAGYRIALRSLSFDITAGLDIGYCLAAHEKGSAKAANGTTFKTSSDRKTIKSDVRARLQLSADHKRIGTYIGYSLGHSNYKSGYIGGTNEAYAKILRFGLTYLLK